MYAFTCKIVILLFIIFISLETYSLLNKIVLYLIDPEIGLHTKIHIEFGYQVGGGVGVPTQSSVSQSP